MSDSAPVAVVTGASRGAGLGIATALAATGWRVYGTGRTIADAPAGGIAVRVDHRDDADVGRLFDRVRDENGRLDLLVNNAAAVSDDLVGSGPFWEKPRELADVLDVGLRSSYIAAWHAAPLLLAADRGLIVFTSSPGSVCYMHGPAYGAQKAGVRQLLAWSRDTRRLLIPCSVGATLLLAMALTGLLPASILDRLQQTIEYFGVFDVRTVEVTSDNWAIVERMAHWQAGWYMFVDHPWLGVGAGNYAEAYPTYFVGMLARSPGPRPQLLPEYAG